MHSFNIRAMKHTRSQTLLSTCLEALHVPHTGAFARRVEEETPWRHTLYGLIRMLAVFGVRTEAVRVARKERLAELPAPGRPSVCALPLIPRRTTVLSRDASPASRPFPTPVGATISRSLYPRRSPRARGAASPLPTALPLRPNWSARGSRGFAASCTGPLPERRAHVAHFHRNIHGGNPYY